MTNREKFLTVKEFAKVTNYSERTVRQWCIDGKIEAHKPTGGRKWQIPEREISRLLKRPSKRIFVTEDGIYEGEKIIDVPAWAKNVNPKPIK